LAGEDEKVGSITLAAALLLPSAMLIALGWEPQVDSVSGGATSPGLGWEYTSFEAQGLDRSRFEMLKQRIADGTFREINAIVVVKGGKVLVEEYFNGEDRETLHDIRSATKVIGSALLGIAIDRGFLSGVGQPLPAFFQDYAPFENWDDRKAHITLEHVLDMTTGLASDDMVGPESSPGHEDNVLRSTDLVRFMLDLPMDANPGEHWAYSTGTAHLLGAVVARASGMTVQDFARAYLFQPLGINDYDWTVAQGWPHTGGGFRMRALDMAKLGLLYVQDGRWQDRQLVPQEWVRESGAWRIPVTVDLGYGYQWWKSSFPLDREHINTFFAAGNGGSHIFVFPDRDLVVVTTGSAFGEPYDPPQIRMMMSAYILPAVLQDEDPHRGEPDLVRVPVGLFAGCGLILASAIAGWPLVWVVRRVRRRCRNPAPGRQTAFWLGLLRLVAGLNAFAVLAYVMLFLAATSFFELVLNGGYTRPLGSLELPLGRILVPLNLGVTVLTLGMTGIAVWSWRRKWWQLWERWHFTGTTVAAAIIVRTLWHWRLAWLP
jgi:CubicO group peptidase (beta-lactamase class C family)